MLNTNNHPFFEGYNFLGFVHRGGAEEATENTLEAFQHASDIGFVFMETDVQATLDGEVVIFHDSNLERVAGINKKISQLSYKEIKKITITWVSSLFPTSSVIKSNYIETMIR